VEPGTVFRFPHDDRPNRVLLHHGDVVMYDGWWPHLDGWGLSNLEAIKRKRVSYYVTTLATVLLKAAHLDSVSFGEVVVADQDAGDVGEGLEVFGKAFVAPD